MEYNKTWKPGNFAQFMRPVPICAFTMAAMVSLAGAASPVRGAALTIVLQFQGPPPSRSLPEMKREFEALFRGSGLSFSWRLREEAAGRSFDNLVLIRFKGKCVLDPLPWLYDERGPLAYTHSTDGAVQPAKWPASTWPRRRVRPCPGATSTTPTSSSAARWGV